MYGSCCWRMLSGHLPGDTHFRWLAVFGDDGPRPVPARRCEFAVPRVVGRLAERHRGFLRRVEPHGVFRRDEIQPPQHHDLTPISGPTSTAKPTTAREPDRALRNDMRSLGSATIERSPTLQLRSGWMVTEPGNPRGTEFLLIQSGSLA